MRRTKASKTVDGVLGVLGVLVLISVLVVAATGFGVAGLGRPTPLGEDPAQPEPLIPGPAGTAARIERIVDGDTVIVRSGGQRERVRLLNIDTPESVAEDRPVECLGPEASAFTAALLPADSTVTLVFDTERRDRYGRLLAAVYTEDGRNASVEIARAGFAYPVTFAPNDRFRAAVDGAVREAQDTDRGLWAPGACP